jgi:TRAP-type C4-dicarboxylate transport system permease small subunit
MSQSNRGFWPRLEGLAKFLSKLTGLIGALALLAAALFTTEGVFVRKVLGWSTIWQIEASVFLLMYACFVGAAFGQMHEHHLNIDLFIIYLPSRVREILLVVVGILSCVVCLVIAAYGWPMWWKAVIGHEHSESLWGPPLWIPYLFLPLGVTLVFLQSLVQIRQKILNLRMGTYEVEAVRTELKDIDIPGDVRETPQGGSHE